MPKVTTSFVDGHYHPKFLKEEEVEEHEKLGIKTCEVSQEIYEKWKKHQKEMNEWYHYWMEIDNKIWEE